MKIAFFNFDGTITKKDSLFDFIKYSCGIKNLLLGLILKSPFLLAFKLGFINNQTTKEKLIEYFFCGWNYKVFKEIADKYSRERIDEIVKIKALKEIKWHKENGHEVVIVSASIENWLEKWCEKNEIKLIATKLEVKNNFITGKFSTKNCFGVEKSRRIREIFDLSNYKEVFAYGDSNGDKEMLELADKKFYKKFKY